MEILVQRQEAKREFRIEWRVSLAYLRGRWFVWRARTHLSRPRAWSQEASQRGTS